MPRGSSNPELEPTSPIDALFGAYDIGRYRVPYLSSVLTVQQCADYLALAGDDPAFTLSNGKIEELFQRDIDDERVLEMSRNYLNPDAARRPAFFNSITVALLVKADSSFEPPHRNAQDNNAFTRTFGPVRVSWEHNTADNLPRLGSFGCIYWNQLGVHAVAIDGQHRLAALKRLGQAAGGRARQLGISIIFLVLDPDFGLKADEKRPVELMRQLFIDLNKHARKVSRSRELLLDDLDPLAVALRRNVGQQLNFESIGEANGLPLGRDGEFLDRLPLELLDWNGEQRAKVDIGPYATSILAFEWALAALCKSKRFDRKPLVPSMFYDDEADGDSSEADEKDYYDRVRPLLRAWLLDIPELEEKFAQAQRDQVPFALDAVSVRKMGERIHEQWGKAITHLLTRAGPYHRLSLERYRRGTLNAQFGTWFQAKAAFDRPSAGVRAALRDRLDGIKAELNSSFGPSKVTEFQECVDFVENTVKKVQVSDSEPEPHLLFFLTGQRALVLALRWMFDVGGDSAASASKLSAELGWVPPTTRGDEALIFARILSEAISHWDAVDDRTVFTKACTCGKAGDFPKALWRGSILKRESTSSIDFSGIAAERGSRMLYLLASCWLYKKACEASPVDAVRAWCKSGRASDLSSLDRSAAGKHLKKALLSVAGFEQFALTNNDANKYPMAFLAKLKLTDADQFTLKDLQELMRSRFDWMWKRAGSGA